MKNAIKESLVEVVSPSLNMERSHLKELYSLRSTAKNCSQKDINVMLKKHNFYDNEQNTQGVFINAFEPIVINNDKVITDYYTGLMWHQSGSIEQLEWIRGADWISRLNIQKYAGYGDWRIPTVEEATSLLRRREASMPQYIDPGFSCTQESIWTRDSYELHPDWFKLDIMWYVDYTDGYVSKHFGSCGHYIRPVRSCKQ